MIRQTRRATLTIAVFLLILLSLPVEVNQVAQVLGIKLKDIQTFPALVALVLSVTLAHLCATMARGARLARALGDDLEILLVTSDKLLIDVGAEDAPEESSLFADQESWASGCYYIVRILERFLSYLVFLSVLCAAATVAALQTYELFPNFDSSVTSRVGFIGSSVFLGLAVLRLSQYWLLRVQTLGDSLSKLEGEDSKPTFPRKYSLSSVVFWVGRLVVLLLWFRVILPLLRLVFWRWRAEVIQSFKDDRRRADGDIDLPPEYDDLPTRRYLQSLMPPKPPKEYSLRMRFLRHLWRY